MPINSELSYKTWMRYARVRDDGHSKYVAKADMCEKFFAGDQWRSADRARLEAVQRPVLTINKILSTISNVLGEQINNRSEISFRPRSGAPAETADVLSKVFKQISDNNQLDWKRSDMYADGIIGSRGFLDVRLDYSDNNQGEVRISSINRKNVLIDSDADDYDPDNWSEVFTTKWVTADDIAVLYSKADAELLRNRDNSSFPYGYDSIQMNRDRFGEERTAAYNTGYDQSNVLRNIRVVERQYRELDRQKFFLAPQTGDTRPIPDDFNPAQIAYFVQNYGFQVITRLVRRIRWVVIADNVVLHDDWSPYKHFTIVPYFPYFRYGHTIGLVENLLGPQELLNKVTSQELHVVNTTANSGYKVKAGALANMTVSELEEKGAQTGLVIEVNGDPDKDIQKIAPNQVPQGLDRISYKAEESIKSISGISDSMQGMDRADVAAKAIQAKRQAGSTNLVKPMDNLVRTDFILARNILDLVQEHYTEPRLLTITHDQVTGESETFGINQPNPEAPPMEGEEQPESPYQEIINDLTLGEYDVVVSSVPRRETLEDSQFEQVMAMREAGIMLPDSVIVDASRLINKKDILKQMAGDQTSPEALAAKELQQRGQVAEVAKLEGEAASKHADSGLKQAKAQETTVKAQVLANTPITEPTGPQGNPELEMAQAEHEADMKEREFAHKQRMDQMEFSRKKQETDDKMAIHQQDVQQKRMDDRVKAAQRAATAAAKPPSNSKTQVPNRSRQPTSRA
jgi:hypothetical protein